MIVQVAGDGTEQTQTYRQLLDRALIVAGNLQSAGARAGAPVIILPTRSDEFLPGFWGALAAGLVPVPLAATPEKVRAVWEHLHQPPVVVTAAAEPGVREVLNAAVPDRDLQLLDIEVLGGGAPARALHRPAPDDVAFLQFSSGSTGAPKGVQLTHAVVLAHLDQAQRVGAVAAGDVIVSWLPYFHDMGLIGAHLAPLAVRIKQVKLEPYDFGKRPAMWYETAARHRATLLPMASFALGLTVRRVPPDQVAALDLSSVRLLGVGAEPIPVQAWHRFIAHLQPARLDPRAVTPLYGLAEATLAVTFPPLGEQARPVTLDRAALAEGRVVDVASAGPGAVAHGTEPVDQPPPAEFLDVGFPVPGGELRIVSDSGEILPDRVLGHIEFRGPNVARGYHDRPDETAATFRAGWLRTGDVGFLRSGRLCVTGRAKDVLFVNGQKYHAHDVEQVVAATPGLPSDRVAVVGSTDPVSGAERVVVFVAAGKAQLHGLAPVLTAIRARVRETLAYDDVRVLPLPAGAFPRTTSGKLRRSELRDRFAAGAYARQEAVVAQLETAATTPDPPAPTAVYVGPPQPRSVTEARITGIWSEVLGIAAEGIGRNDRFLAIGGSSLSAMQVLGRLEETFGGPLEPAVLRDCATVAELAEHLLSRRGPDSRADPAPDRPPSPVRQPERGPAAIVGMACRFPDADTPEAFWDNLLQGRDSVTEVPTSRWSIPPGARARWGAFLQDVAGFDAEFFGIPPDEAAVMDPHARIFLEVAHEALERAGYAGSRRIGRRIGVFVAVGESGYAQLVYEAMGRGVAVPPTALVGNLRNLIAARVAHLLDLSGPALAVDTACSSSLVALHLACRSLEAGECDAAIVGGVSLNLTPTAYQLLDAAQALSPTGRSRAFSAQADGFVPGEGAAAIVIEPLDTARAAGDAVVALVRGSAVNNDGRSLSLMAPNPLLQQAVIAEAYRRSGVDPTTVGYVEAHGTGTAIGDPIEARSLRHSFPAGTESRWLGSVKTNVGHLLNAAGMPSLLKVALSLQHGRLPPSLHYAQPSAEFDLAAAGFAVVTEPRVWTAPGPRRAGINGFGFGGTNAHVILEEPPPADPADPTKPVPGPHLLTLSAASPTALAAAATDLAAFARDHPDLDAADLCARVGTARDDAAYRLALVVEDDGVAGTLDRCAARGAWPVIPARRRPRVAWLFPGQGSQVPGMGQDLYRSQTEFRRTLDELSAAVGRLRGRSLLDWALDPDVEVSDLVQTAVAQPLLVAFGISLAHQLQGWDLRPDAVLGHSVGELAAAAVSGALSPTDAVRLAAERGRAMQDLCAPGAMAAVRGEEADVMAVVAAADGELSVAAMNGPRDLVISGASAAVDAALRALAERGCRGRRLAVSHAFHSPMMAPALDAMRRAAGRLTPGPQRVPLLSTVTGEWAPGLDADYLAEHISRPVAFHPAARRLLDEGFDTLLEVGPGRTLSDLVTAILKARGEEPDAAVLPALHGPGGPSAALVGTVGGLWARGLPITRPVSPHRPWPVPIPTYPFQRTRHWLPDPPPPSASASPPLPASLLHPYVWEEAPLPSGAILRSVGLVGGSPRLRAKLSARLARRGVVVHTPPPGRLDAMPYPSVVLLLAGPSRDVDTAESLDELAEDASTTLTDLARFVAARPTPVIVVTEDVNLTDKAVERVRPGQAIHAGLALALPGENPRQAVRVVDLSSLDREGARVEQVLRELEAPPAPGPAAWVSWRRGRRWTRVPRLHDSLHPDPSRTLPADGCYLITGGTGGIGGELARFLARRGRPVLILAARTAQLDPSLRHELDELGATAHHVTADLAVESEVDRLVTSLPRLDGVFHAAGRIEPGRLASRTAAEVVQVLGPKVVGTFLLARALERHGNRPDTFVLCSSIASSVPGYAAGLGAYAAANAFLDAFAWSESESGRPMQSLNFAAWTRTGMAAVAAPALTAAPQLPPSRAVQALWDAAGTTVPQVLVMEAEAARADDGVPGHDGAASGGGAGDVARGRDGERRLEVSVPAPVPRPRPAPTSSAGSTGTSDASLRDIVAELIAAELKLPVAAVDHDASFLAMGLDSLAAVDLVRRLEQRLGRALPTTLLFEHPSIAQLSAHLDHRPPETLPGLPETGAEAGTNEHDDAFPLTPVQQAFHTSGRLHPEVAAYACLRQQISGPLDQSTLARAFALLEQRHPMLRMRIVGSPGEPRQVIVPATDSDRPAWFHTSDLDRPIEQVEDELCNRVFRLRDESPVRVLLAHEGADRAWLLIVLHHAAADGASLHLLGEELWSVYTALSTGRAVDLAPLQTTFPAYVDATQELRASATFLADCDHWRRQLSEGGGPAGRLPYDGDPEEGPSAPLVARQCVAAPALTRALLTRAAQAEVSLFHLVLAAYVRLLARWTGRREVTVNVARAGRDARLPGIGRIVGPFADTLPLTVTVDEAEDPVASAHHVREAWLAAEQHGSVSTLDLARLLPTLDGTPRTAGAAGFSLARFPLGPAPAGPVRVTATAARTASAATRLGLVGWEFEGSLHFSWNHPARLFAPATIDRLARDFLAELHAVAEPPLPCAPAAPAGGTIAGRIRDRCRRTPEAIAVDTDEGSLTFAELHRAAERLAGRLRGCGVRPNDRVAVLTGAGPDTVIALLGVLYAGAAWVPLDTAHPMARLAEQVQLAGVQVLVTHGPARELARRLADADGGVAVVDLDGSGEDDARPAREGLAPSTDPHARPHPADGVPAPTAGDTEGAAPTDIAYVIFTSGTTGRPKGVPITHDALTRYLDWAISTFGYDATDRLAATAPICFDASVRQLLAPLLVGATIVPIPPTTRRDPDALLRLLERRRVTVWSSVPTLWDQLLRAAERAAGRGERADLSALRWVHVGGEALSPDLVRRWFDLFGPGQRIVNLYGPTEATINATFDIIDTRPGDDVERLPIGRPVAQTVTEVVGPDGQECGIDEPGELVLAGPALTPGYLGEPELTAAAFVDRRGQRFYRTGDRVVLRADGRLEFLGRVDHQVKVRGHRVEPDEIAAVLERHPEVRRAAVVAEDPGDPQRTRLIAYVQRREPDEEAASSAVHDLRAHLAAHLPDYMVPAQLRLVDALPLTPAGKLDRAALAGRTLTPRSTGGPGSPPTTATERRLAAIWAELLGVPDVSREDDFFVLGGDSIAVLEVFSRLEDELPGLPAPTVLYRHRTLAALAAALDVHRGGPAAQGSATADPADGFALTPAQRGFLLAEAVAPGTRSSWLACFRLHGPLDPALFARAVDALVERHLMLRVRIRSDQRPPLQAEVPRSARIPVDYRESDPDGLRALLAQERAHRFDPSDWPLMRLRLVRLGPDEHALVVHAHHLIGDGYSVVLLARDLMALYDAQVSGDPGGLPPLRSTLRDYVALINDRSPGPGPAGPAEGAEDPPYSPPVLRGQDPAPGATGGPLQAGCTIDRHTVAQLRRATSAAGATPYASVLTAYYRMLCRLTGQQDLLLGVADTGRDHALPDVGRLVGPLAGIVPVRVRDAGATFRDQLRHIHQAVSAARSGGTMHERLHRPGTSASGLSFIGAQFLFSYLDFDALGPIAGHTLTMTWDEAGTDLEPPPIGTDLLLTARPIEGTLHLTLRASPAAATSLDLLALTEDLRHELDAFAHDTPAPAAPAPDRSDLLDAALVGYLPAPRDLAGLIGLPFSEGLRETVREALFPDGRARLLEQLTTPLGTSGFVCLPLFADELVAAGVGSLAGEAAQAVLLAARRGARCVSLAGLIPAHTAYGYEVSRALPPGSARLTTGHAATAASVVRTILAALEATGGTLTDRSLAVVGLGSIGRSVLELLVALDLGVPQRLVLCDLAGRRPQLVQLAAEVTRPGWTGDIVICGSEGGPLPAPVYEADLIIGASSADRPILEVDRLRAGAIVVDDSFPHCLDPAAAVRRMEQCGDVLVVGGGLLSCGPTEQRPPADLVLPAHATQWLSARLPDSIASCRIESLMQAGRPDLPTVHGLVEVPQAMAYWEAMTSSGVTAAPLHLLDHVITQRHLQEFSEIRLEPRHA